MAAFTNYVEDEILDHILGKTAIYTMVAVHVALSTTTPTEAGGNFTEPSGNGYARKTTAGADWTASSNGVTSNATSLAFPQATGTWGTVTHFGIYDASTAGNLLMWGALGTSKAIGNQDTASFAIGELDITLD